MRKDKKFKAEKNKINQIPCISNKNNEDKKKNKEINSINIEKNIGVKITVGNKLLEMEQSQQKVLELEKIIESQENKIKILNQGVEPYNIKIQELNIKISQIEEENNKLKEKETNYIQEIENLKNKMNEEIKIKNELIICVKLKVILKIELFN